MIALENYSGREQSYVQHVFLESYLQRLIFKTAPIYGHIVYVDGYAGPWQSANERFEDTSFGIALAALRSAKSVLKGQFPQLRMSAHLVEKDSNAYKKLELIKAKFPDIAINTYNKDFLGVVPEILRAIPNDAFTFFLLDPKGYDISLKKIEDLLKRPKSEVIFNFMFDFINRAVNIKDPHMEAMLDALIPYGDWRQKLADAEPGSARKAIIVDAFGMSLQKLGGYTYVAETTVLRPVKDRPLYCLFYATRHGKGIEVFRDSQVEALKKESDTRAATKLKYTASKTGQGEIFESLHDMAPDKLETYLEEERKAAQLTLMELVPPAPASITYDKLLPQVLARHVVRYTDINKIAGDLYKAGILLIPEWEPRKRVPQPNYRIQRPN
jgi:three-Cys-motif partner protein